MFKARSACTLLFVPSLCLLSVLPARAQVLYGSIVGQVEDPSGSMVPNATITATNKASGSAREVKADAEGRYALLSLLAGEYDIKITASGFRTMNRPGVAVSINTVTRIDVRLEVGQPADSITISAEAVQLQTDKSDVRHEITARTITSLPLPGYRNYQTLLNLVPGATPAAFQNAVVDTPGRALTTNVNGTARNSNNTLTDGAANINVWLPHHTAYVAPVESIETVNISTGSFDAEQGMAGGAAITVATKSGTNQIHGSGAWFHNNQHLNTVPFFRSATYQKPLSILNIGSGTIGGPIRKDKLFYFFSYERTMERSGNAGNYSVAPAEFRAGDFSKWANYSTVYDPATSADPAARSPFPGNIVPQNRWNPTFMNIYKDMPMPNQISPTDPNNLSGNYFVSGILKLNRNNYDVKVNYSVNKKLSVWGKYSRMDAPVNGVYPFGSLGGSALGTEGFGETTTQLPTFGYNHTFSPTFMMDGVFGIMRMDQFVGIPGVDKNVGLDVWKIPGTNGGKQYANDPRYGGAPVIDGFGFSYIGFGATWTPVWRHERTYTYQTNFSKISGAHEIRWGFEPRRLELNHWQPETANPRGSISMAGGSTIRTGGQSREPNAFAAALLGNVYSYSKSIQYFEMKTREWQYAFYVRDRWQVNRRLTLNLGLRYEYYPLINRDDRGIERWDPYTNIVYFGGLGGTPRDVGITVSKKLFAPRAGFAYRLTDKTVIRSGYGLTYDPIPFGRPLRGLYPATLSGSWLPDDRSFGWYNQINQGIPDIPTPDVSKGQGTLPVNLDMGPRSPWGGELHRGYIQSWNFTIERSLPMNMVGSIAYVGTRTIHQLLDRDINTAGPGLGVSTANLPLAKLYGRTIGTNMWDGIGYGSYNAFQAALNKSLSHGLLLKASYTWSKTLNFADDDGWAGLKAFSWEGMIRRNYSPAGYDRRHMFTAGYLYELPIGANKKVNLTNKVVDAVAGGWKLSGLFSAYTGTPFTVSGSGSSLRCIGCTQTADQLRAVTKLDGKGPLQPYFDPSSFRDPLFSFNPANPVYRPGTMGINVLYGPGYWRWDPAIFKEFKLPFRDGAGIEFRAESTNLPHTTRWGNPSGASANMRLNPDGSLNTTLANPLNGFMTITSADSNRQFRFGARLQF
ncbi:MAG: TonB-dependent receptor [Acidobacteria bacterium]|nr:TonB-dependent receptor [Acidobacteriota bacterium]